MVSTDLRVVSLQTYICGPATECSNVRQTLSSKEKHMPGEDLQDSLV